MKFPYDDCEWSVSEKIPLEGGGWYHIYGLCDCPTEATCPAEQWFAPGSEFEGDTPEQKMYLASLGPFD